MTDTHTEEIESRSADGADGNAYLKTFVVSGGGFADARHPVHAANRAATVQEALNRGLHPKGDPALANVEANVTGRLGEVSSELTYRVECVPASVDTDAPATVTPHDVVEAEAPDKPAARATSAKRSASAPRAGK